MRTYLTKKTPNFKSKSWILDNMLVFVIVLTSLFIILSVVTVAGTPAGSVSLSSHQRQLRSQVDTTTGAPRSGRDPAIQKQNSLSEVASKPAGTGQRVDKPAAKVTGGKKRVNPSSVLPDIKRTGVLASGCLLDYGKPGEQCLPARTAGNKPPTCKDVGLLFSEGIVVGGKDRLGLDRSKDKTISIRDC